MGLEFASSRWFAFDGSDTPPKRSRSFVLGSLGQTLISELVRVMTRHHFSHLLNSSPSCNRSLWRSTTCPTPQKPFDEIMTWAMDQPVETAELVVSLLLELDDWDDETVDRLLAVSEAAELELGMSVDAARTLLDARFGWVAESGLGRAESARNWWVCTATTPRNRVASTARHSWSATTIWGIDVATRMAALRLELESLANVLDVG